MILVIVGLGFRFVGILNVFVSRSHCSCSDSSPLNDPDWTFWWAAEGNLGAYRSWSNKSSTVNDLAEVNTQWLTIKISLCLESRAKCSCCEGQHLSRSKHLRCKQMCFSGWGILTGPKCHEKGNRGNYECKLQVTCNCPAGSQPGKNFPSVTSSKPDPGIFFFAITVLIVYKSITERCLLKQKIFLWSWV